MHNIITLSQEKIRQIPIKHEIETLKQTILTDDELLIQIYSYLNEEIQKTCTKFIVISLKNEENQIYYYQDEVFQLQQINQQIFSFLAYNQDYLLFFNCLTGIITNKYNGSIINLIFHPQVNLHISEYRDLFYNQAFTYSISKNQLFCLVCDFSVMDKNEIMINLQQNGKIVQTYSYITKSNQLGTINLYNIDEQFILIYSIVESSKLNYIIINTETIKEYDLQLTNIDEACLVKVFNIKKQLVFIFNENNCGNPWIICIDQETKQQKYCQELIIQIQGNQFALIFDVFLINQEYLFVYFEMNIDALQNEQFIQSINFSNDLNNFKANETDYLSFPESSLSTIIASNSGFVLVPRAVEIGQIKQNFIDIDIQPLSINSLDTIEQKIEKINKESQIIIYKRLPNIYYYVYHYLKHCNIFQYQGENCDQLGQQIVIKMIQNEEQIL